VYNYGGADGILLRGEDGGASQYVRRGMSFLDVDGPGHGGTLREKKLYAPPDSERVAKAVIDYLIARPGVEPDRIGLHGSGTGGSWTRAARLGFTRKPSTRLTAACSTAWATGRSASTGALTSPIGS